MISNVEEGSTAYSNSEARYAMNIVSGWENPSEDEKNIGWSRDLFNAMKRFSSGAAYLNFLGEEGRTGSGLPMARRSTKSWQN
jgi:hypothetical protein